MPAVCFHTAPLEASQAKIAPPHTPPPWQHISLRLLCLLSSTSGTGNASLETEIESLALFRASRCLWFTVVHLTKGTGWVVTCQTRSATTASLCGRVKALGIWQILANISKHVLTSWGHQEGDIGCSETKSLSVLFFICLFFFFCFWTWRAERQSSEDLGVFRILCSNPVLAVVAKMRQKCLACRRVLIDLGEEIVLIYLPCESPTLLLAAFLCCECKAWNWELMNRQEGSYQGRLWESFISWE